MPTSLSPLTWLIPGELMVNALPTFDTYPVLWDLGIRAILTLCAESEGRVPDRPAAYPFAWQRLVLPDSHYPVPLTPEALGSAIAVIRDWTQQKMPVYVHCLAGMERSPLVSVAYLCVYHHLELWEAHHWVKQKHPRTAIQPAQLQVLRTYLKSRV